MADKTICESKPTFLIGKRNERGGLTLGVPLVYSGLMADHTLHTSDGTSHPSQLVVSDYKTGAPSSLVTGENAPLIASNPNILVSAGRSRAGMDIRLNPDKVRSLKSKYPSLSNSSRLNKFFIQSFSKAGNAPTVAQYAKIMKDIQSKHRTAKNFQGSPLEYKRILDYFQFTLVQTLNKSNGKLFLYRPSVHKIHENIGRSSNYKEAIMASYVSQNEDDFLLYDKAYFATKDRPAGLASVVRGVKTVFKRSSAVEKRWLAYEFSGSASTNINKIRNTINEDIKSFKINIEDYVTEDYRTSSGEKITYFLNYDRFLALRNSTLKAIVLFYWMFNYRGDTNGILLQKFISIIDTFHDFTGPRATGFKPTEGSFTNIWPSGTIAQQKSRSINFDGLKANMILKGDSGFLVQILGRNIYRLAKDDGAASIVGGQNRRSGINSMRKLSHLLYFFANVMGGTKDLIGKCEEYASDLLVRTGVPVENKRFCNDVLNNGGKHALVIDTFSAGGLKCIKERSVIHGVGVMDPAPRGGNAWKNVFAKLDSRCVGRGTKHFQVEFEFDNADQRRIANLNAEYRRQMNDIYKMKGDIESKAGFKRSRNNNTNANQTTVKRRPIVTAKRPVPEVVNLTKNNNNNNNNNRSLNQLAEQNRKYYEQIMKIRRDIERSDKLRSSTSSTLLFKRLAAMRKHPTLVKEEKRLRMLRQEGLAAYYKKTGDKTKETTARNFAMRLKESLSKLK